METPKTLKMIISAESWIMILLLITLIHTLCLRVNGCGVLDPLTILKTIKNEEDGETIHCVNIYKQAAFSHPQLRNHTIQMEPSGDPFGVKSLNWNRSSSWDVQSWHKKGEFCPEGTIPILQSSPDDFPNKTTHDDPLDYEQKPRTYVKEYAVGFLPEENAQGASADINVWNPNVHYREYSASQVWVTDGGGRGINTVEAGWLVTAVTQVPFLFIYWTSDGYGATGCYNLCCGGFVQTSNKIVLGGKIEPVSIYGGTQRQISITIHRDIKTGNWWLTYQGVEVGYWPPNIFNGGLRHSASLIEWGGEVINSKPSPTGFHTSTDMGSGHFPREGFRKAAWFKQLKFLNAAGVLKNADNLAARARRPDCYDIEIQRPDTDYDIYFYYGGPGFSRYCMN